MEDKLFIRVPRDLKREAQAEGIRQGLSLQAMLGPTIEAFLRDFVKSAKTKDQASAERA